MERMTEKVIRIEGIDPAELYGVAGSNIDRIGGKFPKLKMVARCSPGKPRNKTETQEGNTMKDFELRYVGSHVEVYTGSGVFLFSADTVREAMEELAG